jgi:hypothetical protein
MPGLRFKSPIAAFQVFCRGETPALYDPASGQMTRDKIKRLDAEFGVHSGEGFYHSVETDRDEPIAIIRGHFFDSEAAQIQNDWTEQEREHVEKVLLRLCDTQPEYIQLYEAPAMAPPWGNYDSTDVTKIPLLADELDVIEAAIAYESQNENREKVLKALKGQLTTAELEAPEEPEEPEEPIDEDAEALVAS